MTLVLSILTWFVQTRIGQIIGIIALCGVAFLGLKAHDAYEYHSGYVAGGTQEATKWLAQREKDQAALDAYRQTAQKLLNQIASEHQLAAQEAKDAQADADLRQTIAKSPTRKKVCLPRNVVRALNRIGQ